MISIKNATRSRWKRCQCLFLSSSLFASVSNTCAARFDVEKTKRTDSCEERIEIGTKDNNHNHNHNTKQEEKFLMRRSCRSEVDFRPFALSICAMLIMRRIYRVKSVRAMLSSLDKQTMAFNIFLRYSLLSL